MNPSAWNTASLDRLPQGEIVKRVLSAAVQAVDPAQAVARCLRRDGSRLLAGDQEYDLSGYRNVWVVGTGKAGAPMAEAAVQIVGERVSGGLVIVKEGYAGQQPPGFPVEIAEAGHPLPDARGVRHTQRLVELLAAAGPGDLVLCLISGGGSALMTAPYPGLTLADFQLLTSDLLACGASIDEINTLRKHLDRAKGGGLARTAAPAQVLTLVLSDVVGDPLDVIASGPTVPDPSTYAACLSIIEKYDLARRVPPAVLGRLLQGAHGELPETPKPGDPLFERVTNQVVGNNRLAAEAALRQAAQDGLHTLLLTTFMEGEARHAGRFLAGIARQVAADGRPLPPPACIVAGGETTVTLTGGGRGGRNQELALGAVRLLAGLPGAVLVSLATDGGDGPTDAAGAVVTAETLARARAEKLDPDAFLRRNDAYPFFAALDDLLRPGPTRTNVNDLAFLFLF